MSQLRNASKSNLLVAENLIVADTALTRLRGLLGRRSLDNNTSMWIHKCNSIHTWFMKFDIDVVFVDRSLTVRAIRRNIRPWHMVWPVWKADSVFEFSAGVISPDKVEVGDQLHVDG